MKNFIKNLNKEAILAISFWTVSVICFIILWINNFQLRNQIEKSDVSVQKEFTNIANENNSIKANIKSIAKSCKSIDTSYAKLNKNPAMVASNVKFDGLCKIEDYIK